VNMTMFGKDVKLHKSHISHSATCYKTADHISEGYHFIATM